MLDKACEASVMGLQFHWRENRFIPSPWHSCQWEALLTSRYSAAQVWLHRSLLLPGGQIRFIYQAVKSSFWFPAINSLKLLWARKREILKAYERRQKPGLEPGTGRPFSSFPSLVPFFLPMPPYSTAIHFSPILLGNVSIIHPIYNVVNPGDSSSSPKIL